MLCGLIVAAGVSSCAERYKPLLPVGNEMMIRRTVRLMQQAGVEQVVVVTGYLADWIQEALKGLTVTVCHNPRFATTEMIDSIRMGIRSLPAACTRLLITPADVPMANVDTLHYLLDHPHPLIVPCHKGAPGHPVLVSREAFGAIQSFRGEGGLREAVESTGMKWFKLPVDDESVTMDAHTADEYSQLLRHNVRLGGGSEQFRLHVDAQLRAVDVVFDAYMAQFLDLIAQTGSIKTACKCMQMSYSKGWRLIHHLEETLGFPVLRKTVGGADGGGSKLTKKGKEFLSRYQLMEKELLDEAQRIFEKHFGYDIFCNPKY